MAKAWRAGILASVAGAMLHPVVALAGGAAGDAAETRTGAPAEFRIGISQYPSSLHPFFDSMVAKSVVLGAALRPLTAHDASWSPVCLLCTVLPSFENGRAAIETYGDGKTGIAATYTLKDGLFWADGTPVTSADFVFARDVARHPQSGAANAEFFARDIRDITVIDDRTFTIHFDREKCAFAAVNDFYPLPAHIERAAFEKNPAQYKSVTAYNTDPSRAGLYMGPYRVTQATPGAAVTLRKNPYWQGKQPVFDGITFRAIENSAALTAHLLSGGIDYIAGELGLSLDQALSFEKRLAAAKPGQYRVTYKPGLTYEHIDIPHDIAPFDDVRVRRAMLYAINRMVINDAVFGGRQNIAATNINPLDRVFHADGVAQYPYDPDKAASLLDAAGWRLRGDGFRYNAAGEKLTMPFMTTAGNKSRELIQQAIQSDWRRAGIDAQVRNEPPRVLFGQTMRRRDFKGPVMYAWMSAPDSIPRTTLHSGMVPQAENAYAGQNYPAYRDPRMDAIIDDLEIVCAADKNAALWRDLQVKYAEDLPALPLYYRADSFFVPVWLTGLEPTGHQYPTTLWVENWRTEE